MASLNLPAVIEALADAPQPGQWTEFDRPRQVAFLEALADRGDVRAAAKSVGISHPTAYRARRSDPAFRMAWTGALIAARPVSEQEFATRAIDGVEENVMYRGEVVATRRRYDLRLLLAHLGRLDKLTEDARASAFADDFEAALARFAAGEEQPAAPADPEAANSSPGQWNSRFKSNSEPEDEELEDERLEECPITGEMLPPDDCLRNIMEAERPAGAPTPRELVGRFTAEEIADEQFAAFDARVDRWWLVVPPTPGVDDPEEWTFARDR